MKMLKKLQNPFVLGAQGFVLGALIVFTSPGEAGESRDTAPVPHASILAPLKAGL
jgi:hypothetical protein